MMQTRLAIFFSCWQSWCCVSLFFLVRSFHNMFTSGGRARPRGQSGGLLFRGSQDRASAVAVSWCFLLYVYVQVCALKFTLQTLCVCLLNSWECYHVCSWLPVFLVRVVTKNSMQHLALCQSCYPSLRSWKYMIMYFAVSTHCRRYKLVCRFCLVTLVAFQGRIIINCTSDRHCLKFFYFVCNVHNQVLAYCTVLWSLCTRNVIYATSSSNDVLWIST
jgi:hypothetical protein